MNKKLIVNNKFIAEAVYIVFLLGNLIQTSYLPAQFRIMRMVMLSLYIIGYILCVFKLATQKYSSRSFLLTLIFIFVGIATYVANRSVDFVISTAMLHFLLVITCAQGINFDKTIKTDLVIRISFTVGLVVLCCLGIVNNITVVRSSGLIRYSMGFAHPNRFGAMLFLIVLYLSYLRREKINWKDVVFQIAMLVIIYRVTDSRSSEVGVSLVIAVTLYELVVLKWKKAPKRKNSGIKKFQRYFVVFGAVLVVGAILYLSFNYNSSNSKMYMLNTLFNTRLELGNLMLHYYEPSLFGTGIQTYSWDDVLSQGLSHTLVGADILYLYIYLNYGIVSLALYIYIVIRSVNYSAKNNKIACFALVLILMLSCMENQYLPVSYNIFILYFTMDSFSVKRRELKEIR